MLSANSKVLKEATAPGMSVMKMINSVGPKIFSCGTPDITSKNSDLYLSIVTHCDLDVRYALNHFHRLP